MYHQFVPSEEEFGFIPNATFKNDDPSGAFGSVAIAKAQKQHNYTLLDNPIHIDSNENIVVKKYKSLLSQFEDEEENYLFAQWDKDSDIEDEFKRWKKFHLLMMVSDTNPKIKALRTKEVWDKLIKQRQDIIDSLQIVDEDQVMMMGFQEWKKAAQQKFIGLEYFEDVQRRCNRIMKIQLETEVEIQQKLALIKPQAAPNIYGWDDTLFTISMQKLDAEIVATYPDNIPAYLQYQMVALVSLFNKAGIRRKDGNVKNYMFKGLRAYAIDVGMDTYLEADEKNFISHMFFSRVENKITNYYNENGIQIIHTALDEDILPEITQKGLNMMNFLDAVQNNPEDFHFFQLEDVYTEEDIQEHFQTAEPLWDSFVQGISQLINGPPKLAVFWGNETWWCAKVGSKYILSENVSRKIHKKNERTPSSKSDFENIKDDFLTSLPKNDHSIVITHLNNTFEKRIEMLR